MEMTTDTVRIELSDPSGSGQARRVAIALANQLGFDCEAGSRAGIVATELATNVVKHGGGGELLLQVLRAGARAGIGFVALDRGRGIADVRDALRDGYSTAGTAGTGLGAVGRQASRFDLYSTVGAGCALMAEIWPGPVEREALLTVGGINVPYPGETVSGDAWDAVLEGECARLLLADGIGHGSAAAEAARRAVATCRESSKREPAELLEDVHGALRSTRGAAVAIAELDRRRRSVRFAGLGNIAGAIVGDGTSHNLVSHHGTAGHQMRRIQQFEYPWPTGASLVLHSDGLLSHWTLDRYPGLVSRHPTLIAAILYRDYRRARDDTSVVVLKEAA
jgi:anti-sigma regulatory factor (Ser/Thr protein kinase)